MTEHAETAEHQQQPPVQATGRPLPAHERERQQQQGRDAGAEALRHGIRIDARDQPRQHEIARRAEHRADRQQHMPVETLAPGFDDDEHTEQPDEDGREASRTDLLAEHRHAQQTHHQRCCEEDRNGDGQRQIGQRREVEYRADE